MAFYHFIAVRFTNVDAYNSSLFFLLAVYYPIV